MPNTIFIDRIRILFAIPCLFVVYQLVAHADIFLIRYILSTKSYAFLNLWRYISEIVIAVCCITTVYFVVPSLVKRSAVFLALVFYFFNFFSFYIIPIDIDQIHRTRFVNTLIYVLSAIFTYLLMAIHYELKTRKINM